MQTQTQKKLQAGDKYLSIVLLGQVRLVAFKNKDKKNPKEPDFSGNGIAVWVNEKKAAPEPPVEQF